MQCDSEIAEIQKSKAMLNRDKVSAAADHEEKYAALQKELAGAAQSSLAAKGSLAASSQEGEKKATEIKAQLEVTVAALDAARTEAAAAQSSAAAGVVELERANADLAATQVEFAEYKARATRVLQTKETLIADMRDGGAAGGENGGVGTGLGTTANAELVEVTRERESMREELSEAKLEAQQLQHDLTAMEEQQQEDVELIESQLRDVEALVENERRAHADTKARHEEELKDQARAVDAVKKQRLAAENEVALKQAELERVRIQLHKQAVAAGGPSIDTKMRALTDNVLQKQNKIEVLSSANTALTVQLEAEKKRAEDTRITIPMSASSSSMVSGGGSGYAGPNGNEDDVNWLTDGTNPNRMRPLRSMMGHGGLNEIPSIANGAQFLDVFSIRLGVFLRKNPAARLIVLGYMALLHVWTLVVLLHYSPDIHDVHDPHNELSIDPNMMVFRDADGGV